MSKPNDILATDNYVAWLRYTTNRERPSVIRTCDSDAEGAFRVYRQGDADLRAQLATLTTERDALAATIERAPMMAVEAIVDYCYKANRRCGIELRDAVILQMQQSLANPATILAARDARIRAEALREATKTLRADSKCNCVMDIFRGLDRMAEAAKGDSHETA